MRSGSRDTLWVRTPEGVSFSFHLATPVTRLAAWAIDKATVMAAWSVVSSLIALLGIFSEDLARGIMLVGFFVVSTGYGIALEWRWEGQTLGKRVMHLRVMDERGLPLRFSQVVVRNCLRAVDALPVAYLVGGVAALLGRKSQRLGDVAAATIVVHEAPVQTAGLAGLEVSKYNSLRGQQHVAARLRTVTPPALANAARQALLRREEFEPEARLALFRDLAGHFRRVAHLPPELEEGISDEQFVRNVVEVLFVSAPSQTKVTGRGGEPAAPAA
ncbi:RDD family protein [Oleiharenicola lentus]|jgi:uncharacterized RDD family membrane protein YckC|uniref:RDD family protein n=1 Tax=Oleiharenicola lentus TaxID=2508720 RepID=A0A4Q1C4L1_9BACT|nr:RDD family protein [Oleiharenicola lentus]